MTEEADEGSSGGLLRSGSDKAAEGTLVYLLVTDVDEIFGTYT